jgi:REP element-mobilizing transposase RayT
MIRDSVQEELRAYLGGVLREWDSPVARIGLVEDHVHILCHLSKHHAIKKILEEVKKSSSKWIKSKPGMSGGFYWQAGYGAFSVSPTKLPAVDKYIENQAEHHKRVTFQEEYRRFLREYNIEYDERYVWD